MDPTDPAASPSLGLNIETSETSGMTDPYKDYSITKDKPFGTFSTLLKDLPFPVQLFSYLNFSASLYFHTSLWKIIRDNPLSGNVQLAEVMRDKDRDPKSFLWVAMYYIKTDIYKDLHVNKGIHDFLREHVEPHIHLLEPSLRQNLMFCLNPPIPVPTFPGTSPPLGRQQTETGVASAMSGPSLGNPYGLPLEHPYGFPAYPTYPQHQQVPQPTAQQATQPPFQTSGLPRTFGASPYAAQSPAPAAPATSATQAAPVAPPATPATATLNPAAATFNPMTAPFSPSPGAGTSGTAAPPAVTLSAGPRQAATAGPSIIASPPVSTVSSMPLTSANLGSLAALLDTPTGCSTMPWTSTSQVMPHMFNLYGMPHTPATSNISAATSAFFSAPLAPYPHNLQDILTMMTNPLVQQSLITRMQPHTGPIPSPVINVTQHQTPSLPKFNGTITSAIPDLLIWFRKLRQVATSTGRPLLETLDFHVEGEAQHFVEQLHRTNTTDETVITSSFFAHYHHLQKDHTRRSFNKLFYGRAPVKLTKPMRMQDYIVSYRNLIADASVNHADLQPGTTTSINLCDRFILGLSPLLQRELRHDPSTCMPYDDLTKLYTAAIRQFEKHEKNPNLYSSDSESHDSGSHRRSRRDSESPPPSGKRHKNSQSKSDVQGAKSSKKSGSSSHKSGGSNKKGTGKQHSRTSLPDLLKRAWQAHKDLETAKQSPDWKDGGPLHPIQHPSANLKHTEPYPKNPNRGTVRVEDVPNNVIKHVTGSYRVNKNRGNCVFCLSLLKDVLSPGQTPQSHYVDCEHRPF